MKSAYPIKALGDVISLEYGKPLPQSERQSEKGIPAYGANGILCWSKKSYRDHPSIIVGRKGSAGEVTLTDGPFWPSDVTFFVEHDARETDLRYLYYLLKFLQLPKLAKGVKPGINRNDVYGLLAPVPDLKEQKRLVAILDEAFEEIGKATAHAERNIANSEELFDSRLQSMLDSQDGLKCKLSDICSIEAKLIDPKKAEFSNLLHIGGGNMVTKSDESIDLKTASEEGLISGKFFFDQETVLYSKIRPYLMKVSRPDFSGVCSADVYPLKPRMGVLDRNYLYFLLLTKRFTDYAVQGSGRAGMPKVNREHLFEYTLSVPDLDSQRIAAANIDQALTARSQLSQVYRTKLRALAELRLALLHKAFSGELSSANKLNSLADVGRLAATTSPEYTADILSFAYAKHRAAQRDRTFGRVKGQKVLQLVEAVAGIDLGREPIKDAAGPNDSAHMRRAEDWAAQQDYFAFEARGTGGYVFRPGRCFEKTLASAYARLSSHKDAIAKVIDLLVPMDTQEAEVLATVHAAWNNLIIDHLEPTRDTIVAEARENWTASKLEIPVAKFEKAIQFIRQNDIIPDGSAKPVRKRQESLF